MAQASGRGEAEIRAALLTMEEVNAMKSFAEITLQQYSATSSEQRERLMNLTDSVFHKFEEVSVEGATLNHRWNELKTAGIVPNATDFVKEVVKMEIFQEAEKAAEIRTVIATVTVGLVAAGAGALIGCGVVGIVITAAVGVFVGSALGFFSETAHRLLEPVRAKLFGEQNMVAEEQHRWTPYVEAAGQGGVRQGPEGQHWY